MPEPDTTSQPNLHEQSSDKSSDSEVSSNGKDFAKPDLFRVLVTGFGPYGQWNVNPSWLAAKPLNNVILYTDPANHSRAPLPDDKPPPPLDEKLLAPRPIHISTLEIPATYQAILNSVPGLHLRPPVLPEDLEDLKLKPPENGYDFMFHIGLAGRGPLRLERCGHKLGYNMKDATESYASVVIPQPKDFSRRGPDGRPMTITEKAERDRLASMAATSEIQNTPPIDSNARPNRGFGGELYDAFSDELNTDLDVTRIVQDMRQTGIEALQTIYSSMDGGHFVGDFLYYCSLAESKRSVNPYEKRRNTQVLFLHCAPVGHPLQSEEVTDAIKRIVLWVCNEIQISGTDDTPDLPPVGTSAKNILSRIQKRNDSNEGTRLSFPDVPEPSPDHSSNFAPPPVQPPPPVRPIPLLVGPVSPPPPFGPLSPPPPAGPLSPPPPVRPFSPPPVRPLASPPVQPPPVQSPLVLPPPVQPPTFSSSSNISSPIGSGNGRRSSKT
ncbi:hypothetical protein AN958_02689 [Leucoagaricus sp. SymC.cos]|nr:hypothetical protein AN958_02689 [Leucoagaricus sp. SymC.cos]